MTNIAKRLLAAAVVATTSGTAVGQITTRIDLTPYVNGSGGAYALTNPYGSLTGNTGTAFSAVGFNLLNPAFNDMWVGWTTGLTVDIQTNVFGATSVYTLFNTLYGTAGLLTATVEFRGSQGASQTFSLIGDVDVRDFNNYVFTNNINNTTTQVWWTDGQFHRLDAQFFRLAPAFQTQTLTSIRITTGTAGFGISNPILHAITIVAVPEPSSYMLMCLGVSVLCLFARMRKKHSA